MKKKKTNTVRVHSSKRQNRARQNRGDTKFLHSLGQAAGTFLGGPVGGQLGLAAGKLISRITGFGDYKVSKNSITMGNSVPTFLTKDGGMEMCHREFLFDVVGSTGFVNRSVALNPGLLESFPFASAIAANFEEYSLEGLVFEYRPSSGSAVSSSSSALGVVVMATDYDATNPPFANKQQMESYQFSTSTVPFTGCLHPVECARSLNVLGSQFVRTGPAPLGSDLRLFDMGNFQIATVGMQSSYVVGELWVTYDLRLRKPRLPKEPIGFGYSHLVTQPAAGGTNVKLFGANGEWLYDSLLLTYDKPSGGIVLANPGTYLLSLCTTGLGLPSVQTMGSNMHSSTEEDWFQFGLGPYRPSYGGSSTALTVIVKVDAYGVGAANTIELKTADVMSGLDSDLLVIRIQDFPEPTSVKRTRVCDDEKSPAVPVMVRENDQNCATDQIVRSDTCDCNYRITKKGCTLVAMCKRCCDDSDCEAEVSLAKTVRGLKL